jgi:hypothetical protein
MAANFFVNPDIDSNIRELVARSTLNRSSDVRRLDILSPVFRAILESSLAWDLCCQYTINKYGPHVRIALNDVVANGNPASVDLCLAFMYLFLIEADLSSPVPFSDEFLSIRENIAVQFTDRTDRPGILVKQGMHQLPIQIVKNIINSSELGSLKDIGVVAQDAQEKIKEWREELTSKETTVVQLNAVLDRQKDAYNFVLLNQGFAGLETVTKSELRKLRKYLFGFGSLMFAPALIDLYLITKGLIDLDTIKTAKLIAGSVISATSTLILLYFFRIVLREIDSKEAQLVQVRLRMTLCQFIQNYADYAAQLKEKNIEALSKFESLIFSGIVGTQDKLPSTFDGIEQLGALIKNVRSK